MLILKEPIKLKSLSPIVREPDGFYERMTANYSQLPAKYGREELFHLLNRAPEIYVEEGGTTTFVTQNYHQTNRELKLTMLHNLFNRLTLWASPDFTYQDTVFVQNMLEKLGVKNVSEFMEQLRGIQEDTENIRQLSKIYEKHTEALRNVIETVRLEEGKEVRQQKETENSRTSSRWLHSGIFRRLGTKNLYHTAAVFQKSASLYGVARSTEIEMGEQIRTSHMLKLEELKSQVLGRESLPLEYRVNIYEEGAVKDGSEKSEVVRELAQAVLLNLADALYQNVAETKSEDGKDRGRIFWRKFEGDFHQTLKNTLSRFSASRFEEGANGGQKDGRKRQKRLNTFRRQEITQLNTILELSQGREAFPKEKLWRGQEEVPENSIVEFADVRRVYPASGLGESRVLEEMNETSRRLEGLTGREEERERQGESLKEEVRRLNEENRRRRRLIESTETVEVPEKFWEEFIKSRRVYPASDLGESRVLEEMNETSRRLEGLAGREEERERHGESLKEEVRRLNEENRRRLKEGDFGEGDGPKGVPARIDREKTRRELLRLIESTETVEVPEKSLEEFIKSRRVYPASDLGESRVLEEMNETSRRLEGLAGREEERERYGESLKEEVRRLNEENRRRLKETVEVREKTSKEFSESSRVYRASDLGESRVLEEMNETGRRLEGLAGKEEERERHGESLKEEVRLLNEENRRRLKERGFEEGDGPKGVPARIDREKTRRELLSLIESTETVEVPAEEDFTRKEPAKKSKDALSLEHPIPGKPEEMIERLCKELGTFLTCLESEKQTYEAQKMIRVQEALLGKGIGSTDTKSTAKSTEAAAKKLVLLMSSLEEVKKVLKTEKSSLEEVKKVLKTEKNGENRTGSEVGKRVEVLKREIEPRRAYIRTLDEITKVIEQYPAKENDVFAENRQMNEQKSRLLELLHFSKAAGQSEVGRLIERLTESVHFREEAGAPKKDVKEGKHTAEVKKVVRTYLETVSKEEEIRRISRDIQTKISEGIRTEQNFPELTKPQGSSALPVPKQPVKLAHRESGAVFSDESHAQAEKQETVRRRTEFVDEQTRLQKMVTKRQTHTQIGDRVQKNSERINEMVHKGVQRQINSISEQVYHMLEKKLINDRKRRGY